MRFGPPLPTKMRHLFADIRGDRFVADERTDRAVEDDVGGPFVHGFVLVEVLQAFVAEFAGGVKFALHDVVLLVHGRQTGFRFDED